MPTTRAEREEFAGAMARVLTDWLFPQAVYKLTKDKSWPRLQPIVDTCFAEMGTESAKTMQGLFGAALGMASFYAGASYNPYADQYEDDLQKSVNAVEGQFLADLGYYLESRLPWHVRVARKIRRAFRSVRGPGRK